MKLYEEWLVKAERDLLSAKALIELSPPLSDTAIYHTQQCAEKALKVFLAYRDQEIEKTHDLRMLVNQCKKIDKSFE